MKRHDDFVRWLYRGGHPNRLAQLLNRGWAIVHSAGLRPNRLATLEVPGRRTGRVISFPVVIADHDGERYVVAMLGEETNWVRNVRAAGGRAVLRHGRRESVRLENVAPEARPPILRRYLACTLGTQPPGPCADCSAVTRKTGIRGAEGASWPSRPPSRWRPLGE